VPACTVPFIPNAEETMSLEIILIGDELISGKTRDLNGWYASGCLLSSGLMVTEMTTVGDNYPSIASALRAAVKKSQVVIVTGGLGPTEDDRTTEAVSRVFRRPLMLDQDLLAHIRESMTSLGLSWSPSLEKLAWLPKGARILDSNRQMCGFSISRGDCSLYFLPGVPEQMRYLMNKAVIPDLLQKYRPRLIPRHRLLKVYGMRESQIADAFEGLSDRLSAVIFGFYPSFPENHITMTVRDNGDGQNNKELDRAEQEIRALLRDYVFASDEETMESVIGEVLKERGMTMSVAESCTGGLIAHRITSIPGSSAYFDRGATVYSNRSKVEMLGIKHETISLYGAVSDETVREMAEGIKRAAHADIGIAVTGIAGPDGGTDDKPVGTVYIGLSADKQTFSGRYLFPGDRGKVKLQTSEMALDWVRRYLYGYPFIPGI
jgi:nicotinamide-nucleotide amidase